MTSPRSNITTITGVFTQTIQRKVSINPVLSVTEIPNERNFKFPTVPTTPMIQNDITTIRLAIQRGSLAADTPLIDEIVKTPVKSGSMSIPYTRPQKSENSPQNSTSNFFSLG